MRSRTLARLSLAIAFSLLAACGPPWTVFRQSGPPSALAGMQSLGVSFDWSQLMMIGMGGRGVPEAQWLSTQPPDDQSAYLEVRQVIEGATVTELQRRLPGIQVGPATGQETHQLIVRPTGLTMGFYRFVMSQDSRLDATYAFGPTGQMTDEIGVRTTRTANMANAAITGRMQHCAERLAALGADFVRRAQQ